MNKEKQKKFFQNEKKFVLGKSYETIKVIAKYRGYTDLETCDEYGDIVPNSELFLGKYVSSYNYGYGDNGGRRDEFINNEGKQVYHYLDYDGTTRYREVKSHMDERINFLKLVESTSNIVNNNRKNEHINTFLLNPLLVKEISSFMNPLLK
jgi:hypothetical protein